MCPLKGGWVASQSEKKETCAAHEDRKCLCGPREGTCLTAKPTPTAHVNIQGPQKQKTANILNVCNSAYSKSMLCHNSAF